MAQNFGWVSSKFKDTQNQSVVASTNAEVEADYSDTWCGRWDNKLDAIKSLFNWYKKKSHKTIRWYVDWDGNFRWFEVGPRLGQLIIFNDDPRVVSCDLDENATNIFNVLTGSYGQDDEAGTVTVTNNSSIAIYGRCIDDSIQESSFSQSEMTEYLNWLLDQKSVPIYTGTLVLEGYHDIPPGKQINFPDHDMYSDIIFTVVEWTVEGGSNGNLTTLSLSNIDLTLPNEFEVMQSIAKSEADKIRSKVGIVETVTGDKSRAIVDLESGKGKLNTRYVSKL